MFSLLTGVYKNYLAAPELNVLIVGDVGVGKTTLLERLKVTQIHYSKSSSSSNRSRGLWCPAPKKYHSTNNDSDNEEDDESSRPIVRPKRPSLTQPERRISLNTTEVVAKTTTTTTAMEEETNYDQKDGSKMLPARLIRPTIGTNVAKITIQGGCKLHVYDVGGRLKDLWTRYYEDADAVIFVYRNNNSKTNEDDDKEEKKNNNNSDPRELLEQVRSSVPDDVPFLVLGHLHCGEEEQETNNNSNATDTHYSLDSLLPHYHNPSQAFYFANARTGQGVRTAMEWLITLARRQQILRQQREAKLQEQLNTEK